MALLKMTGSDHIVMGTDYPATGLSVIESSLSALRRTELLNEEELSAVATNALHAFPSLRERFPAG